MTEKPRINLRTWPPEEQRHIPPEIEGQDPFSPGIVELFTLCANNLDNSQVCLFILLVEGLIDIKDEGAMAHVKSSLEKVIAAVLANHVDLHAIKATVWNQVTYAVKSHSSDQRLRVNSYRLAVVRQVMEATIPRVATASSKFESAFYQQAARKPGAYQALALAVRDYLQSKISFSLETKPYRQRISAGLIKVKRENIKQEIQRLLKSKKNKFACSI